MSPPDKTKGLTLCLIHRSIANSHMHIITSQRIQNTHNNHITPKPSQTYTTNWNIPVKSVTNGIFQNIQINTGSTVDTLKAQLCGASKGWWDFIIITARCESTVMLKRKKSRKNSTSSGIMWGSSSFTAVELLLKQMLSLAFVSFTANDKKKQKTKRIYEINIHMTSSEETGFESWDPC